MAYHKSIMERREIIIAVIVLVLLGVLGYFVFESHGANSVSQQPTLQYQNATFGYSFQYPAQDAIQEDSPQYVLVGEQEGQTFDGIAEIDIALSEASSTYTTFDDFAQSQAALDCDASGPDENISCPSIQSSQSFTTQSGVSGEEFYFNELTSSTGTTTTATFGPFFAFDISGNTAQENAQFSALIIHPLISSTSTDPSTIEGIANSLQLIKTS